MYLKALSVYSQCGISICSSLTYLLIYLLINVESPNGLLDE